MTVTVGFAPATTPGLVTGGSTAAADSGAPEGLFAALLAMLAPGQTPEAAASDTADKITSTEFGALIQTLAAQATSPARVTEAKEAGAKETEAKNEPNEADVEGSSAAAAIGNTLDNLSKPQGKSLLKDLGDALIALNDSVEAGQPVDPALEKKLNEAVDALAIYLGALRRPPRRQPGSARWPAATASFRLPASQICHHPLPLRPFRPRLLPLRRPPGARRTP